MDVHEFLFLSAEDSQRKLDLLNDEKLISFLEWFNYLGLEKLFEVCDTVFAEKLKKDHWYALYERWTNIKYLPCKKVHYVFKDDVKLLLRAEINGLHLQRITCWGVKNFQPFLTDDVCGDEMWGFLLEKVPLP